VSRIKLEAEKAEVNQRGRLEIKPLLHSADVLWFWSVSIPSKCIYFTLYPNAEL
jgi:hypothetical protein